MYCKLSGLATEAGPEWQMNDMRPWLSTFLTCFGPSRLMWGSDWPVIETGDAVSRWHTITERFLFDTIFRNATKSCATPPCDFMA